MAISTVLTLLSLVMITWFQWNTSIRVVDSAAYSAAPFPAGTNLPWVYNLCLTIIIQHACFIVGLVNASFIIFCLVIRMELARFAADFRKAIDNSTCLESIDVFRKRHRQLCRLVELADSIFCIPVAVVITISMTFLCVAARLFSIDSGMGPHFLTRPIFGDSVDLHYNGNICDNWSRCQRFSKCFGTK